MRSFLAVAVLALSLSGCDKKTSPAGQPSPATTTQDAMSPPTAPLGDLSTSLAAARTAFNAHKGEARFLTLLSPT